MTPEEAKFKNLVEIFSKQTYKYQPYAGANYLTEEIGYEAGKKCALICVDEMKKDRHTLLVKLFDKIYADSIIDSISDDLEKFKSEIEKL